jgi:hypothetical protein
MPECSSPRTSLGELTTGLGVRRLLAGIATGVAAGLLLVALGAPASASAIQMPPGYACSVTGGTLAWGVKKEFRDYVTGPVAAGGWTTSGGASYRSGQFRWGSGSGTISPTTVQGLAGFIGSVTFTDHAGMLVRTLSNPEVQFVGPTFAYLLVTVSATTSDGTRVDSPGVQLATLDLTAGLVDHRSDVFDYTGVPATLTIAGSQVLGGYQAGAALDPVDFRLSYPTTCGAHSTSSSSTSSSSTSNPSDAVQSLPPVQPVALAWYVLGLGLLVVVPLLLVVLRRRAP